MLGANRAEDLSGWIFPDGRWYPCENWWHVAALYDLRDEGMQELQNPETAKFLAEGDEAKIKEHMAECGFIKVSRKFIDGCHMTEQQLKKLQELLFLCDLECEFAYLLRKTNAVERITVQKILKMRRPILFSQHQK